MSNPLFTANRWDWQPHRKLGQSSLVVLCAGSMLLLAPTPRARLSLVLLPKSASNNIQKWFLSPTGRLNLDFILRENLLLCSSYFPLRVSQLVLWDIRAAQPFRRWGEMIDSTYASNSSGSGSGGGGHVLDGADASSTSGSSGRRPSDRRLLWRQVKHLSSYFSFTN
jgi:hypothetical protein